MTKMERNAKTIELALTYAEVHPETSELINAFLKMKNHPKAEIKIIIGKLENENCFSSYLVSNLAFPSIKFSEENGNLLILIANHRENIISIPIDLCKVLSHKYIDFGNNLNAEKDRFVVRLFDLDYQIDMNFENRYIA